MPEIFADQHARASEAGIERPNLVAPGKEAPFVEQAIGGQLNFMVYVEHASAREIGGGNVETVTKVFVHEPHDNVQVFARLEKMPENGIILPRPVGNRGNQILDNISG